MENAEEVLQSLDSFSKLRPKNIPRELEEYLCFVARTGDPVFHWSIIKSLFREKLLHVLTEFHDSSPGLDLPPCPNVDPFNYDTMKNCLLERIDSFSSAPFTVQRICELLTCPRKQYSRIDKYMRAIEKNILVVSTREPGNREPESGDPLEAVLNGDGFDMHIEIEMDGNLAGKDESTTPAPRNDTSYMLSNDYRCITTPEIATNCTNEVDKHSDTSVEHHPEINGTSADSSKIESDLSKEETEQNLQELQTSYINAKSPKISEEESIPEETNIEPVESTSDNISQTPSETFLPDNKPEENTDNSETDSNSTENSITSQTNLAVEENNLVSSDAESSNDEVPFLNVLEPVNDIQPTEILCDNDFQEVLKSDYTQISLNENILKEKQPEEMDKLFQIVCDTVPEAATEVLETEKSLQPVEESQEQIENEVSQSSEIIEQATESPQILAQSPEKIVEEEETIRPDDSAIALAPEVASEPGTEIEQMVADVENNFISEIKCDDNIEQNQVESMDVPESAMECEDTPVASEPMDQ